MFNLNRDTQLSHNTHSIIAIYFHNVYYYRKNIIVEFTFFIKRKKNTLTSGNLKHCYFKDNVFYGKQNI